MDGPELDDSWQDEVEARVRAAIARALEGTAQQLLRNGAAKLSPTPQEAAAGPPEGAMESGTVEPGAGPTREQMLGVIRRHLAEGREHFGRDGRPLESPEAVLQAMEEDGFVIVGQRVALPAGYRAS